MVSVSRLQKKDIQIFRQLFVDIFKNGFEYYPKRAMNYVTEYWSEDVIDQRLSCPNYIFLMAQTDSSLVGYLIGKMYPSGRASILWLGVLANKRNMGVGRELVRTWEAWAKAEGAKILMLSTADYSNKGFYTRLGYKEQKETIKNDWGMKKLVFRKVP